jgi:hypothetical protein
MSIRSLRLRCFGKDSIIEAADQEPLLYTLYLNNAQNQTTETITMADKITLEELLKRNKYVYTLTHGQWKAKYIPPLTDTPLAPSPPATAAPQP